jgi:hypothetical protein
VHHTYFVPVHSTASLPGGTLALRTGRLLSGERIGPHASTMFSGLKLNPIFDERPVPRMRRLSPAQGSR